MIYNEDLKIFMQNETIKKLINSISPNNDKKINFKWLNAIYAALDDEDFLDELGVKTIGTMNQDFTSLLLKYSPDVLSYINEIPKYMFAGIILDKLIIPDTITDIGLRSFSGATINNLILSSNLNYIEDEAFSDATIDTLTYEATFADFTNVIDHSCTSSYERLHINNFYCLGETDNTYNFKSEFYQYLKDGYWRI